VASSRIFVAGALAAQGYLAAAITTGILRLGSSARSPSLAAAQPFTRKHTPFLVPPATVMSKRSASGIVNPYLKDTSKKPKAAAAAAAAHVPVAVSDPSSHSSLTTASTVTSSSTTRSCSIINPYAKQQRQQRLSQPHKAADARPASPIDLTSSPESSPKKRARSDNDTRSTSRSSSTAQYKIFCDLDGVLVDFDAGVLKALGRKPEDMPQNALWAGIARTPSFYENLPWMKDGRQLWDAIMHLDPDILTGVPMARKAREQKAAWCRRELGMATNRVNHVDMAGKKKAHEVVSGRRKDGAINVITCWSSNKHFEGGERTVLIDDRDSLKAAWVAKGGIFVHHTCTTKTLAELQRLGIL